MSKLSNNEEELKYLITLNNIPLVGPKLAKQLLKTIGAPKQILNTPFSSLIKIKNIGPKIAANISKNQNYSKAEKEIIECQKNHIICLSYQNDNYPHRLKQIPDSPLVLYSKGESISSLNASRIISIVGTRTPTMYAEEVISDLCKELSQMGVLVLSGLAYGVDTIAHKQALKNNIATAAVLGNGLKYIYPQSNHQLASKILNSGLLISELGFDKKVEREHFPMRNRIIAGMSDAVIVIQSKKIGGSMITAEFANQYHRDVFAIPGRLKDPLAEGTNFLIKSHRASLLTSASDIAYLLSWDKIKTATQKRLFLDLEPEEEIIYKLIKERSNISIDLISKMSGFHSSKLSGLILNLEFKGIIRPLPGKRFTLI